MPSDYKPLEAYGLVGNLETCALVARDGAIDWLPLPHLESPSIFAALLDPERGGHFTLKPRAPFETTQAYAEPTNVLHTRFRTPTGQARLVDFMPVRGMTGLPPAGHRVLLRKLEGLTGTLEFTLEFAPRFDYARVTPRLEATPTGVQARWRGTHLVLDSPVPLEVRGATARARFVLEAGTTLWFGLRYDGAPFLTEAQREARLEATLRYWRAWAHRCEQEPCLFEGPWHDLATRSGLALKLLTHPETGAIAAAPTTSLPEAIGGVRNWDYRYAWIRDASFTVQALHRLGHVQEALEYFRWICAVCAQAREPAAIRVMYTLHGDPVPPEETLDHLRGYRDSRPVRVGNAAATQTQLDIYGELVNAAYEVHRHREGLEGVDWRFIRGLVNHAARVWRSPDAGIWEVRSPPQHFTYSKLMCWVALDRGIRLAERFGLKASLRTWKAQRKAVRDAILTQGFSPRKQSFVRAFGTEELDATGLLIPLVGFLPPDDPRVRGTIAATQRELVVDGWVRRYTGEDGLPGQEGAFLLATFWLVHALALGGETEPAAALLEQAVRHASPLGLLAEEIDPTTGAMLGNYPQAFSHIGLIHSALALGEARTPAP
ncbi:glycoside hydrolase family 15 protein [Marinithermus hydrothermalis]|uniref:Glycoside hydrolase 15-related protein n=1 Tax=Marinithermus hydrothermalis (strain DSM 14884 / JCM 11576 / T1) TaxID=869210 RepID=F2NKL1_MARHT|nr:glycoside hydrolase family 15 protein [Marinithermus hydrothermalis]AEB12671.1 glycoside hydrolase 15-related protein [Marinithermus hydrothermalis DSM 14884]